MKKVLIGSALILTILLIILLFVPINFNIDRVVIAQTANMLIPDETEEIKIIIQGRYSFYLFRANQFNGRMIIEGYEFTQQTTAHFSSSLDILRYHRQIDNQLETLLFGDIRTSFLLRNIDIVVYNRKEESNLQGGHINMEIDDNVFISTGNILNRYNQLMEILRKQYQ